VDYVKKYNISQILIDYIAYKVKRPGHEADHSREFSGGVKNAWSCTFAPLVGLHALVLQLETPVHFTTIIAASE
jgi:hypothetical protein